MTLSLYVLRHAKAEDPGSGAGDHARALKPRGRKAAALAGAVLARLEEAPELVLSSTATRARETAELAAEAGGFEARLSLRREIYDAGPQALLAVLTGLDTEAQRVLLVGHQPGLSLLVAELTGGEPELPTGALVRLDFELERWSELGTSKGRLVWLLTPSLLSALDVRAR